MKYFLLLILATSYAHADDVTDYIWRIFTGARTSTNSSLSSTLHGSCSQLVAQSYLRECREQFPQNTTLNSLEEQFKKIELASREKEFIRKAHAEQKGAITCEIMQLRALYNEESVKPFYGKILEDICHKLPELKTRWDKINQYKKIVERANSTFEYNNKPNNFRFADTSKNNELIATINKYSALMKKENSVYLQLRSSIWKIEDPHMDSFVFDSMRTPEKIKAVCAGGESNQDYKTYFPVRKKFQDEIIASMIGGAQDNLFKIGETPEQAGVAGIRLLLQKSDWARTVSELGTVENAMMMCDMDQKYASGDDETQKFLTVGTFALGGAGAFLKVAKFATFLRPATIQRLLSASRVLMMASSFPYLPLAIEETADACMGPSTAYSLQGNQCPLNEFGLIDMKRMIDIQTRQMEKENCVLRLALSTAGLGPDVVRFFKAGAAKAAETFVPINMPKTVSSAAIRVSEGNMISRLRQLGIETTPIAREAEVGGMGSTYVERNVRLWKTQTMEGEAYYGTLRKVTKLPPAGTEASASTNAFLHPEMAKYKQRLDDMGYTLAIDTSLPQTGAEAYNWGYRKVVAMRPDSNWQTFVHEFQHVEYDRYLKRRFDKLRVAVSRGNKLEDVLKLKIQNRIGPERVRRLQNLLKKEVPELAINEALSVDEELRVLGFRRYIPGVGSRSVKYSLRYRISLLEKVPRRTAVQEKTLIEAKRQYETLNRYENLPTVAAAAGLTVASGAITHKILYPEDYRQIVYDENGNVVAQKHNGAWESLVGAE